MRNYILLILIPLFFLSCSQETDKYPVKKVDWESRKASVVDFKDFHKGKTYLPIYSHIYHIQETRAFDLTITVSLRNISTKDSVYLRKVDYYDTEGKNVRHYLTAPIYMKPMETLEIVIHEQDIEGGSGANFIFDWAMRNDKNHPLFEAVMISTYGQQGISFTTRGVEVVD